MLYLVSEAAEYLNGTAHASEASTPPVQCRPGPSANWVTCRRIPANSQTASHPVIESFEENARRAADMVGSPIIGSVVGAAPEPDDLRGPVTGLPVRLMQESEPGG